MKIGQKTQTVYGDPVEIKEIKKKHAVVYQLDEQLERIPKLKGKGFLLGRLTIN